MDKRQLVQITADIVASHASMNELSQDALVAEIDIVYNHLAQLAGVDPGAITNSDFSLAESEVKEPVKPVVPLAAAFGADKVFCMVCGKGLKTLKRHISTAHDLKPGAYRRMFDIPAGTSLVAKNYSEARKKMAKDLNLAERLVEARAVRAANRKAADA